MVVLMGYSWYCTQGSFLELTIWDNGDQTLISHVLGKRPTHRAIVLAPCKSFKLVK